LIAHLIRRNLDLLSEYERETGFKDDFKFVLFVSFANREEAIGIEMMEALRDLCQKRNSQNFELYVRLGTESKERWSMDSIER
jgi:hypothetical protein